ncbi:uncharacterized protein LOC141595471 [Silene latifolia]|uniref:uncharacterized protein LOC141595471 n=1 Tax=Silene latifolia TaxID=37657 RepID=UPI003D77ECFE
MGELIEIPVLDLNDETIVHPDYGWSICKGGRKIPIMEMIAEDEELCDLLQFTHEDIQKEVEFWNNSIFCYILGANPPWEPIVIKPWNSDVDLIKEVVDEVSLCGMNHNLPDNVRFLDEAGKAGDFNIVLSPIERIGENSTEVDMEQFQECVSLCSMDDIQATRALFTWSNKQEPEDRVYIRLDMVMGNEEWQQKFGDYIAHFHPEGLFGHCPCTIVDRKVDISGRRSFKYFNMWGQSELFQECVAGVWQRSSSIIGALLEKIQKELVHKPGDTDLMQQPDSFLIQKAKIQWSIEGELNTTYFHNPIKKRMMQNKVFLTEDQHGKECNEGAQIQAAFLKYYQGLLGDHTSTNPVNERIVKRGKCCTEEYWEILNRGVTVEEVRQCLFSIPKDKSPGPDGYTS